MFIFRISKQQQQKRVSEKETQWPELSMLWRHRTEICVQWASESSHFCVKHGSIHVSVFHFSLHSCSHLLTFASMELNVPWVAVRFGEALLLTLPLQLLVWQSRNTPWLCIVQVFTGVSTDSWHLLGPGWLLVWSSLTVDSMNQAPYEGNMAVCPLGLYSGSRHVYDLIGAVLSELL